ncbi:MAG TPA: DNA methyltransferase [Polyangiaceae bacterium]|nr:DNA methyltransferase [Polyangiaceae bacterium]
MAAPPVKIRRSLTNVGGPVQLEGSDELERATLSHALDVLPEDGAREHVHAFHSYPARLHAATARRLVERLSARGGVVLDPFCGSGTVLVEARVAGRRALGIDANPLAVELTWLKTRGSSEDERIALLAAARVAAEHAEDRRHRKAGATHRYGREDTALFEPHVLMELDGLRAGLGKVRHDFARRALRLVLSAILVKVSRRTGDTSQDTAPRRLSAGYTTKLFQRKAEELARLLAEFAALLPRASGPPPNVRWGDARKIDGVDRSSVDLVVTSPPYPGNYDYLEQHALRLRWLGLDAEPFAAIELGARRHLAQLPEAAARARWSSDLGEVLTACARVLRRQGKLVLIVADTVIGRRALYADDLVRGLAPTAGLDVSVVGSQLRPHFHGPTARAFDHRPRREHAIICRPKATR